jgi:hypothetical protein
LILLVITLMYDIPNGHFKELKNWQHNIVKCLKWHPVYKI